MLFEYHKCLIIDPATTSGYCIMRHFQDLDGKFDLEKNIFSGECVIETPQFFTATLDKNFSGDPTGRICNLVYDFFKQIIEKEAINFVAIEQYMFSRRSSTGSGLNVAVRSAIEMLCDSMKIRCLVLGISFWKKTIAGRSIPTKEQKNLWKSKANKMFIVQALKEKYGIEFPEKIKNEKGKLVNFKYDLSDVVAQAICVCQNFFSSKAFFEFDW